MVKKDTDAVKNLGGRPTKLTDDLVNKALEYIVQAVDTIQATDNGKVIPKVNLPTIEGLSNYLNVNRDTLYEWEKEDERFSDILTRVRNNQAERLINNGLAGTYNPVISKLLLSKHGYVERSEQDTTHHGDVTFINDIPRPKG